MLELTWSSLTGEYGSVCSASVNGVFSTPLGPRGSGCCSANCPRYSGLGGKLPQSGRVHRHGIKHKGQQ